MIIATDICPKSGLKRNIKYIQYIDNPDSKKMYFECDINYHNPITDEFLGSNILEPLRNHITFILSNDNVLDGIGEYDYWKGPLNDLNSLLNKGYNSIDSYISYIILKAYLKDKLNG